MTSLQFLAEWAVRSSVLILIGALLLWALRMKDSSIRLAAWTAMLFGSLAIPVLTVALPKLPLIITMRGTPQPIARQTIPTQAAPEPAVSHYAIPKHTAPGSSPFDPARAALTIYFVVTLALLLRLCVGLTIGLRLLRGSRATGQTSEGMEMRESDRVTAPVTLGIARPAIVLPADWRHWDAARLDAVLAHERSHIRRHDPALQLLSAMHRALLWHSPLSWFLHSRIVRVAEEASDDVAVAVTRDRAFYAEVLLEFIQRGVHRGSWRSADARGVPMARYGRAEERIQRILDGPSPDLMRLSRGVTRWSVAAILALVSPLVYIVAAGQPQSAAPVQTVHASPPMTPQIATSRPQIAPAPNPERAPAYLTGLGSVAAFYTVTVKPRIDGQLLTADFKEGDLIQAGALLASIDPRSYQIQLDQAEGQLEQHEAQLRQQQRDTPKETMAPLEVALKTDQANLNRARLQLTYTRVTAPITGVAGLRLIDPGNMVHADEVLVVITQLQPIAVLFTVPEDSVPQVRASLKNGAQPAVEAWNRDNTVRIATGQLTAIDNLIDEKTGLAKLKAVFDNKDSALFPGQFVNMRVPMSK